MGTLGALFLLFFAVIGTLLIVFNPSRELTKIYEGHRQSEIKAATKAEPGKIGGLFFGVVIELIQTVIVEPAYILYGITHHLGNVQIAQGALLIFIAGIVIAIGMALYNRRYHVGDWVYPMTNWPMHYVRTAIFSMPTLYLWYLFFVVVGIAGSVQSLADLLFSPVAWVLVGIFVIYVAATIIVSLFHKPIIQARPKEATEEERAQYYQQEMPPQQW